MSLSLSLSLSLLELIAIPEDAFGCDHTNWLQPSTVFLAQAL
jgi:hypothetical protein